MKKKGKQHEKWDYGDYIRHRRREDDGVENIRQGHSRGLQKSQVGGGLGGTELVERREDQGNRGETGNLLSSGCGVMHARNAACQNTTQGEIRLGRKKKRISLVAAGNGYQLY